MLMEGKGEIKVYVLEMHIILTSTHLLDQYRDNLNVPLSFRFYCYSEVMVQEI